MTTAVYSLLPLDQVESLLPLSPSHLQSLGMIHGIIGESEVSKIIYMEIGLKVECSEFQIQ